MNCKHNELRIKKISIDQVDGGRVLSVAGIHCRKCGENFYFKGAMPGGSNPHEIRTNSDSTAISLPVRSREFNARKLFCPECKRRVYGSGLDQAPIVGIGCKQPRHEITFSDGSILEL